MSENEMIWRATDADGRCWLYGEKPDWSEHQFYSQDGRVLEYYGTEKPPPGECWEIVQMRKGDIDTDGEPIGWKIVGIGKDGSVLCEKDNGQRRRYSFGDGAKDQPTGEAWERLINAVADYSRNVGIVGPRGETIKEAWKAYEAAQSAEPQRPKIVCLCGSTRFAKEFADANERETLAGNIVLSVGCFRRTAPDGQREPMEESVKAALDVLHKRKIDLADEVLVLNVGGYIGDSTRSEIEHARKTGKRVRYLEPGRTPTNDPPLPASTDEPPESQIAIQQGMIERLTKERDEAVTELRDKLERPEMPEAVRSLIGDLLREVPGRFNQAIAAVEAHYAPPFRIQGPGVYSAKLGKDKELVIRLFHHRQDGWLGYFDGTGAVWLFDDSGRAGGVQLTKYLRPLEG